MSDLTKKLMERAEASGMVGGGKFFTVTDKKKVIVDGEEITVEKPNGRHRVKILSEKIGKGKSYDGKEVDQLQLEITDNGTPKLWDMPLKNKDGTIYYLIEALQDIEIGEEFEVEASKMATGKYAKRISKIIKGDNVPVIQLDDQDNEGAGEAKPPLNDEEEIHPEDIPF